MYNTITAKKPFSFIGVRKKRYVYRPYNTITGKDVKFEKFTILGVSFCPRR